MAFSNITFSVGGTLSFTHMNAIQDNFIAVCSGDSGSPKFKINSSFNTSIASQGLWALGVGGFTFLIPEGVYNVTTISSNDIIYLEMYDGSAWLASQYWDYFKGSTLFSDGVNFRFRNAGSSVNSISACFQKFY